MSYSPPLLSSDSWVCWSGSALSASSSGEEAPLCAGCRLRILDKYYLSAVAQKWHTNCLRCSECGVELENQISCFEKEGHIYCKDDYQRIYANARQCYRCFSEIQASDLVIKARHTLFHVDCFRCATCDLLLQKGDLFGMLQDALYCKAHWESLGPPSVASGSAYYGPPESPLFDWSYHQSPDWYEAPHQEEDSPDSFEVKKRRGRKKRKMEGSSFNAAYLEIPGAGSPGGGNSPGGAYPGANPGDLLSHSKTKRARTSFKHHQLRIMRGHFQVNQNPDSRELKMLSQKTGLDKKVLQVWFQNARAKWRRVNTQSGGLSVGPSIPEGSSVLSMESLSEEAGGDSDSAGPLQT